jgi:hypothetical protein
MLLSHFDALLRHHLESAALRLGLALRHHEQIVRGLVKEEARLLGAGRLLAAMRISGGDQCLFRELPKKHHKSKITQITPVQPRKRFVQKITFFFEAGASLIPATHTGKKYTHTQKAPTNK